MRCCGPAFGRAMKAAVFTMLAGAAPALASDQNPPAEWRVIPYSGSLPSCADPGVLNEIASRFAAREAGYWGSALAVVGFGPLQEFGYRSNGPSYIPRRYCRGEAYFNDGVARRIVYNIGEALGFIGLGDGVTWCVVGLDRHHAFSPDCRAAGP